MTEFVWKDLSVYRPIILDCLGIAPKRGRLSNKQAQVLREEAHTLDLHAVLRNLFSSFRGYHGCRPQNVQSYYERGIEPLSCDAMNVCAYEIFGVGPPSATKVAIAAAIQDVGRELREGRVYLGIDDRALLRDCGHYMIYGSEYLCAIGATLRRETGHNFQRRLKNRGLPTLLEVRVPLNQVSDSARQELARAICEELANDAEFKREESTSTNFSFTFHRNISAEWVVGHSHPTVVRDPFESYSEYRLAMTPAPSTESEAKRRSGRFL